MPAHEWREQAACTGHLDPDAWFTTDPERTATAVAVCSGCPVRAVCADEAERLDAATGIWGGSARSD